jgi:hypothetical protein
LAGNVTPGDAPGFPVTITQPGSYRLSSNLTAPPAANGIEITVSNVTIDLNGFTVLGVPPPNPPFNTGIRYIGTPPVRGFIVRNGSVAGFVFTIAPDPSFVTGSEVVLQDLYLATPILTASGIEVGANSRVVNVTGRTVSMNPTCPSVIAFSVFLSISPSSSQCALVGNATSF